MGNERATGQNRLKVRNVAAALSDFRAGRRAPVDVGHVVSGHGSRNREECLVEIADRQHGLITAFQLRALGIGPSSTLDRRRRGWLAQVHRGVYAVGRRRLTDSGVLLAPVLASGLDAVLSHRAALVAWGALRPNRAPISVTAPRRLRSRPGIHTHRSSSLAPPDLCALDFIPLTAPARSLLDLGSSGEPDELELAVNELRVASLLKPADLDDLRTRTRGHHGWGPLNCLLAAELEPGFSRSEAERRMLLLIRSAALAEPQRNVRLHGYEVDFFWPDHRLVVEIDGYAFHSGRPPFEHDRRKQADLQDQKLEVLRFTWLQITTRQTWVVARLASALARRRP